MDNPVKDNINKRITVSCLAVRFCKVEQTIIFVSFPLFTWSWISVSYKIIRLVTPFLLLKINRCNQKSYVNCSFSRTTRLWNYLLTSWFPVDSNLLHLCIYFYLSILLFTSLLINGIYSTRHSVTPCFIVALMLCAELVNK